MSFLSGCPSETTERFWTTVPLRWKNAKGLTVWSPIVMLQNVLDMSQAFRELIDAGYSVNLTAILRLSVYPYGHVRRNSIMALRI